VIRIARRSFAAGLIGYNPGSFAVSSSPISGAPHSMKISTSRAWMILVGLQALLALVLFSDFLSGRYRFAYYDIGSDTFFAFVPYAVHMVRTLFSEPFGGWSFQIGLGGQTAWLPRDGFSLFYLAGGTDNVLALRIWIYILKIVLGGGAFFALTRCFVARWETAVIAALAYSFCGYMVVNGQWDPEATTFVLFPLILWAIVQQIRTGNGVVLPAVIAVSLVSGVFFVSLGIFLLFAFVAFTLTSSDPRAMIRIWLTRVLPLCAVGFLLASPILLPTVFQMMDSPRVSGGHSVFRQLVQEGFTFNPLNLMLVEIGALFHKDIFGIGNGHYSYINYLESPEFFIGVLMFVVIPQLWKGTARDRKVLLIFLLAMTLYVVFPLFRFAAMGFAAPYFRTSTLWVTIALLLLAARAINQILEHGVNGRLLLIGIAIYMALLLLLVQSAIGPNVKMPYVGKILGLTALAGLLLWLAQRKLMPARWLPTAVLCVIAVETVLVARPSFYEGRLIVTDERAGFDNVALDALQAIRAMDKGVFRVEKNYQSVSKGYWVSAADAVAQDYMGIKSYASHGAGVVDFHLGVRLLEPPRPGNPINMQTNQLSNAGQRFVLNSLLGVKYVISKEPVAWPGFVPVHSGTGYQIYRNELALPLGVVQTSQIAVGDLARLFSLPAVDANAYRDLTMLNAVVVNERVPGHGDRYDLDELLGTKVIAIEQRYFVPAGTLQETGLKLESFSNNHLAGSISPTSPGILVFSIPFHRGWSLKVDGVDTPIMRANFGMLAAPVQAGQHKVELDFRVPGQGAGLLIGALGLALLILRRRKYGSAETPTS
jgi:uncharacterized membrane protein YfhO